MGNNKNSSYRRYMLTYPFEGSTIHKTKSFRKAVKRCYKEFKNMNDIPEGLFSITDLDKRKEYQFKVSDHKIYTLKQSGGDLGQKEAKPKAEIETKPSLGSALGPKKEPMKETGNSLQKISVTRSPAEKKTTVTLFSSPTKKPEEINKKEKLAEASEELDKLEKDVAKFEDVKPDFEEEKEEPVEEPKEEKIIESDVDQIVRRISKLIPSQPTVSPTRIDVDQLNIIKESPKEEPKKEESSSSFETYPYKKPRSSGDIFTQTMYELEVLDDFDRNDWLLDGWCTIM